MALCLVKTGAEYVLVQEAQLLGLYVVLFAKQRLAAAIKVGACRTAAFNNHQIT